jgi:ATP-dependent 26S proteasome regulatory subunit
MTVSTADNGRITNQHYLVAAINALRLELEMFQAPGNKNDPADAPSRETLNEAQRTAKEMRAALAQNPEIETLSALFGLSEFECKILLMCAAVELDTEFAKLIASIQGGATLPTFSLALAALDDPHWSALSPEAPLRYWRLIKPGDGALLTKAPLKIDEPVLHFLTGVYQLDERLAMLLEPAGKNRTLSESQQTSGDRIAGICNSNPVPLIELTGNDQSEKIALATYISEKSGLNLYLLAGNSVPVNAQEITELTRLWNRDAALYGYALYIDCNEMDFSDRSKIQSLTSLIENVQGTIFINSENGQSRVKREKYSFVVQKPTKSEQIQLWKNTLENTPLDHDSFLPLTSQFDLGTNTIQSVSNEVLRQVNGSMVTENGNHFSQLLWKTCCAHTRPQVDTLAQRIEPMATWNDIILPSFQEQTLREIVMHVKQRHQVYNEWGFGNVSARGLGITALFAGESGTGKTMASEVLANDLNLDLYRIDLSQVVNKYIGETEKNLRRIFDAAESGGAILLFDEADALFGKRSDVKDSHDRYSNIEVSYLLQRMEAYRGLAILTTNMKSSLDVAFLRRIRFVVQFPYPDVTQRAEIWSKAFPEKAPQENIDCGKLARLNIPGGNIRNIALNAAFIAAADGQPIQMAHIAQAARGEYIKLERPLSQTEMSGW